MTTTATTTVVPESTTARALEWRDVYFELRWYAAYTSANHEKRVSDQLHARGIEHFLPLYTSIHLWKDRRVRLQLPLFPGYVFVRLPLAERLRVLELPGVARLVGFGERPVPLPELEINTLRGAMCGRANARPHPYLAVGRRVLIQSGPLAGMKGILLRKKGDCRVVLSLELIQRSIAVEANAADLLVLPSLHRSGCA